jgi:transcription elongation factor Elf1
MKKKRRRKKAQANADAAYVCESCGEEIVVPVDVSAGESQEYVEDCPVCCCPNVIHVELDGGEPRVWAERE